MILYKLRTDYIVSEHKYSYISYGIDVFDNINLIYSVSDISLSKSEIDDLIRLCNKLRLETIHLLDVIEDFLS